MNNQEFIELFCGTWRDERETIADLKIESQSDLELEMWELMDYLRDQDGYEGIDGVEIDESARIMWETAHD